jgi:hypothetical protein
MNLEDQVDIDESKLIHEANIVISEMTRLVGIGYSKVSVERVNHSTRGFIGWMVTHADEPLNIYENDTVG